MVVKFDSLEAIVGRINLKQSESNDKVNASCKHRVWVACEKEER